MGVGIVRKVPSRWIRAQGTARGYAIRMELMSLWAPSRSKIEVHP
jgi:hypothetical protein